jgi:hypothetical protein
MGKSIGTPTPRFASSYPARDGSWGEERIVRFRLPMGLQFIRKSAAIRAATASPRRHRRLGAQTRGWAPLRPGAPDAPAKRAAPVRAVPAR